MQYYILKYYEDATRKKFKVERAFNKYGKENARIIKICYGMMVAACIEMLLSIVLLSVKWCLIGIVLNFVALFIHLVIEKKFEKTHLNKYKNEHMRKLRILNNILISEFNIRNKDSIERLINNYQNCIKKKRKYRKYISLVFSTGVTAWLNWLGGMNFTQLKYCTVILFLVEVVAILCIILFLSEFPNLLVKKYERIVENLEEVILLEY